MKQISSITFDENHPKLCYTNLKDDIVRKKKKTFRKQTLVASINVLKNFMFGFQLNLLATKSTLYLSIYPFELYFSLKIHFY